ncbi:glycosyl transferases group 1 family protein [Synechococcus sp. SYN20]|uniref:glycosyltransferase n=1 Tax=Synechococcus sp. SYN20 TaxID=1050714 RepID=UPI0016464B43|nr:glycosyltransferase [Synechococcus sp. SYN20]QNJ24565.1 glycosyl transferases group 1 family protein [Synechococcus sp. SYN20]
MQRILLFTPVIGRAGVAKVFHQHAKDFQDFAYVEEAVFSRAGYASKVYQNGVELNVIDDRIKTLSRISWLRFLQRLRALKELVASKRFSAVIAHVDGANIMACLLPSQIKKYLVVHGTSLNKNTLSPTARVKEYLIKKLYPKANLVVCVSEALQLETEQLYGIKNGITIRNYFDELEPNSTESDSFMRKIFNSISDEQFILVSHGRYSQGKNLEVLLSVVRNLKSENLAVTLLLVGDGPEYKKIAKRAGELDLVVLDFISPKECQPHISAPDVVLTGFTKNPILFLRASHLFVMPSKWEGYPLSLCEALLCGLPVLASDCPTGPREILTRLDEDDGLPCGLMPIPEGECGASLWSTRIKQIMTDKRLFNELRRRSELLGELIKEDKTIAMQKWRHIISSQ